MFSLKALNQVWSEGMIKKIREKKGTESIVVVKCCILILTILIIVNILIPAQKESKEIIYKLKVNTVTNDERFKIK